MNDVVCDVFERSISWHHMAHPMNYRVFAVVTGQSVLAAFRLACSRMFTRFHHTDCSFCANTLLDYDVRESVYLAIVDFVSKLKLLDFFGNYSHHSPFSRDSIHLHVVLFVIPCLSASRIPNLPSNRVNVGSLIPCACFTVCV
jgi:hypothetical protein